MPLQYWPQAGLASWHCCTRAAFTADCLDLCLLLAHLQEPADCSKLLLKPRLGDVQLEALLPQRVLDRQAPTGVPADRRLAPLRLPSQAPIVTWVCTFKRWRQIGVDPRWACREVVVNTAAWRQHSRSLSLQKVFQKEATGSDFCMCMSAPTLRVWPDGPAHSEIAM